MVALSFRICTDEQEGARFRYSPADWKHYHFLGAESSFDPAREFTRRVHEAAGGGHAQHEVMHLIYLAAAEALLDARIAHRLRSFGIDAPVLGDRLPGGPFEYMVLDEDRVFKANYCEILVANRLAARLGKTVLP
jgi:hypothetical protein